jgi:glycosyltransferase involved in cell wall biosynthesis
VLGRNDPMTIFYVCPWAEKPTGGIKQIFRHVEALSAAGFDAYALVLDSIVPAWFDSSAPVATLKLPRPGWIPRRSWWRKNRIDWLASPVSPLVTLQGGPRAGVQRRLGEGDILVLPEYPGKALKPCGFGAKLAVFNQNAHYTFAGLTPTDGLQDFLYPRHVMAALAVSQHTRDYLQFAFPSLRVLLTPNGVDTERFFPAAEGARKRQIAFMPRKLPGSLVQVLQMLRSRGALDGWQLRSIDGLDESAVAAALRESAIFLSTCHDEGFGLPPLEAGASGCVVVGYTGQAAREFMLPEHCYPIDQGDVLGFAQTLERVMAEYDRDPSRLTRQAAGYVDFIRERYSKAQEGRQVVAVWNEICDAGAQRC